MLDFFRKYQRYFFLVITVVLISSFLFFGTFSAFVGPDTRPGERPDRVIGQQIDGSHMSLSEVQKLSRFIATDRLDSVQRGFLPNLCNDGVIRHDLIKDGLAYLIVQEYFDGLQSDLEDRLEKVKRFKPYSHPEDPTLSAKAVWDHFIPELSREIARLQGQAEIDFSLFSKLEKLYQLQNRLHPEMLRQILVYQHRQKPALKIDERLSYEDLSLFGFHTAADWFGHHFVDLASQFILNAAVAAEEKGYRVSLEEAKGDLIHRFQDSMSKLSEAKMRPEVSFQTHLQRLGFDERSASEVWQKVLLFRKYFKDVGEAAFVDRLPYKDFAQYAKEELVLQVYEWPISISSQKDLAELEFYVKAISPKEKGGLPTTVLSVEEVEKKYPQLVQTTYRAQIAQVSKRQMGAKFSIKEVWKWQTADANWPLLKEEFALADAPEEKRFGILEALSEGQRTKLDAWSRDKMVDQNPEKIQQALAAAPLKERTWNIQANEASMAPFDPLYTRIEHLQTVQEKHILPFKAARQVLSQLVPHKEGKVDLEKNPFGLASKEALAALQKNRDDSRWIQSGSSSLLDQFKLERKEQTLFRTSKESWMKEKAFFMLPDGWSPVHVDVHGEIAFFYLQEKRTNPAPILDQLAVGKETLAADAKMYVAEKLLHAIKKKKAIVIPIQKEEPNEPI